MFKKHTYIYACYSLRGIVSEEKLNEYKKTEIPAIMEKLKQISDGKVGELNEGDIEFTEEGTVED